MDIKDTWLEVPLSTVLSYYADGFERKDGTEIVRREYFVDTTKNVVLFKIVTREES